MGQRSEGSSPYPAQEAPGNWGSPERSVPKRKQVHEVPDGAPRLPGGFDRQPATPRRRCPVRHSAKKAPKNKKRVFAPSCRLSCPSLSAELSDRLGQLSRQEGATLFMTLLAAFKALLWRYAGQDNVVVASPVAGRTRPEVEGLIGFFVNLLALRTDLSGDPSFRVLLRRVRETTLGALAHQDLPFERLVEELQPERGLGRNPLVQVMFALQNMPRSERRLAGLSLRQMRAEKGLAKFDLGLILKEDGEALRGVLRYNTGPF